MLTDYLKVERWLVILSDMVGVQSKHVRFTFYNFMTSGFKKSTFMCIKYILI